MINFFDLSFIAVMNLYVLFVSKHWFYLYAVFTLLAVVCLLMFIMFVPESPKWLHL
jgi:hypothetical protein